MERIRLAVAAFDAAVLCGTDLSDTVVCPTA